MNKIRCWLSRAVNGSININPSILVDFSSYIQESLIVLEQFLCVVLEITSRCGMRNNGTKWNANAIF